MLLVAALAWRDHLQSVRATVWEFILYESTVIRQFTWQRVTAMSHVAVFLTKPRGFHGRQDHKFTLMDELFRSFHQNVPSRVTICKFYTFLLSVQWEEITAASSPTSSFFEISNNEFRLNLILRMCAENCSTYRVLYPWSYVAHALRNSVYWAHGKTLPKGKIGLDVNPGAGTLFALELLSNRILIAGGLVVVISAIIQSQ